MVRMLKISLKENFDRIRKAIKPRDGRPFYEHVSIILGGAAGGLYVIVESLKLLGAI